MPLFPNPYRRPHALRAAIVAAFAQSAAEMEASLCHIDERDWNSQLLWLDTSGLALYLLDRLTTHGLQHLLPAPVLERLQQNTADNRDRNLTLLAEAIEINEDFQRDGVLFANLKGITLSPESVPNPALRCQLDLDFLVCADDAEKAARVLERMGYALDAVSGDTWEFKAGHAGIPSLRDLYKTKPQRSAELHLTHDLTLLNRLQIRTYAQTGMPVLAPQDLYLAQALHLHKHVCSAFTRVAWLLEHRTHMLARANDELFWQRLQELVADDLPAQRALGMVTLLMGQSFGDTPPPMLARLIQNTVSPARQIWIARYGQASLLADFPGTKLYLLLQENSEPRQSTAAKGLRTSLVPMQAPRMITQSYAEESVTSRFGRYATQLSYLLFRLRFHTVEGLRYLVESTRFRRMLAELTH